MMEHDDLVQKMLDADFKACDGGNWRDADPYCRDRFLRGMSAAARVCIEAALAEPTNEETTRPAFGGGSAWDHMTHETVCRVFSRRYARLLPAKEKTPEERVTITRGGDYDGAFSEVYLDGVSQFVFRSNDRFGGSDNDANYQRAEIYREGLIARLKKEQA